MPLQSWPTLQTPIQNLPGQQLDATAVRGMCSSYLSVSSSATLLLSLFVVGRIAAQTAWHTVPPPDATFIAASAGARSVCEYAAVITHVI